MMTPRDFLQDVVGAAPVPVTVDTIPEADVLEKMARDYEEAVARMDLVTISEEAEDEIGPAASVEEIELNLLYQQLCQDVPELLVAMDKPEGYFQDALSLDLAFGQAQGANTAILEGTRAGSLLLGAALSDDNDRVEVVLEDRSRGEATLYGDDALFSNVTCVRKALLDRESSQVSRTARRRRRHAAELSQAGDRTRLLTAVATKETPALPAAGKTARRKGTLTRRNEP